MEELANKINLEIKNSSLYKRYITLKEKVDGDENLICIKKELEVLKEKICKSKNRELLNEYYEKEKVYLNNSFVKEYLELKAELQELLKEIVDILSLN